MQTENSIENNICSDYNKALMVKQQRYKKQLQYKDTGFCTEVFPFFLLRYLPLLNPLNFFKTAREMQVRFQHGMYFIFQIFSTVLGGHLNTSEIFRGEKKQKKTNKTRASMTKRKPISTVGNRQVCNDLMILEQRSLDWLLVRNVVQ